MLTKSVSFDVKALTDAGAFTGLLSPYGEPPDQGGDVVVPGAYSANIKSKGNIRPLLWQHMSDKPIGSIELDDRPDGLWVKGQLLMEDPLAQSAYRYLKAKIVTGLSIGFLAIRDEVRGRIRYLKEIRLFEASIVTFPMNELSQITDVKSAADFASFSAAIDDFRKELKQWKPQF